MKPYRPYPYQPPGRPSIEIGQRTLADCRRRVWALEKRLPATMTRADRTELHRLRVFLHLSQVDGGDNA